mgnify:FL=1
MSLSKRKLYNSEKIINFRELISRYQKIFPNKIAFKYKSTPTSKKIETITYSKFANDIKSFAKALLKLGLKEKRVAIIGPNRYEWCVSYLAVVSSDMIVVPLDKSLPNNEIKSLIKRSEADAVIYDSKYSDIFSEICLEGKCNLKQYICMDKIDKPNVLFMNELIETGEKIDDEIYDDIQMDSEKMAIMLFTSGTTSISKAVCLSQRNICADIYALSQMAKVTPKDTFLSFLPLHHTFESTCTFLYGSYCGITIAFCDGIKHIQKNLNEFNVTGFVCVPLLLEIMYKKVQKNIEKQKKKTLIKIMTVLCNFLLKFGIDIRRKVFKKILQGIGGDLRILIAGGAPMNTEAIKGFLGFGINLLQGYGLTETSPVLAGENDKYKKAGSVGFPLPDINVKIDDPDNKGVGEILVNGPTVMLGYYQNEEATKEALTDGWFHTGDLGYFDKKGFLFVTGRKKDVIVLKNGKNIYPEELEILINELPYVSESMVFGKEYTNKADRNEDLNLWAKIVYSPDIMKQYFPGVDASKYKELIWKDIRNKVNKSMPAYKYIREIIVTDEPLIKTTTQKIKRYEEMKKIK